jgi:large subunit ribosomal protein L2
MSGYTFDALTKRPPLKSLTTGMKRAYGRNNQGKITTRHKGGGVKRRYRLIDFIQNKFDIPARVEHLEYDPNRSARIALLVFRDGERRYILAPEELKRGDTVIFYSGRGAVETGNRLQLRYIPQGTLVYNIELTPDGGGKLVRSAGTAAQVLASEGGYTQLKMPSSEIRLVPETARASIGQVSNIEHSSIVLGKAGRSRWLGVRPAVRGSAMNPVDHPHGGGEGRQPLGMPPKTPWGKKAYGVKTRKRKKKSSRLIVRRRK